MTFDEQIFRLQTIVKATQVQRDEALSRCAAYEADVAVLRAVISARDKKIGDMMASEPEDTPEIVLETKIM
jgi:hypothetical protein